MGISGKPQIEAYGIAEFNALCRESVVAYVDEWERLTERIGFWIDTERAYRTMDAGLHRERLVEPRRALSGATCSTRATRSCPTARAAAPPCRATRSPSATRRSTTPRSTSASRSRDAPRRVAAGLDHHARGRCRPTRRRRSTRTSPTPRSSASGETLILAEPPGRARSSARAPASPRRIPAGELVGRRYVPPFPYVEGPHASWRPTS